MSVRLAQSAPDFHIAIYAGCRPYKQPHPASIFYEGFFRNAVVSLFIIPMLLGIAFN